jgi:hypothetical protein
MKMGSKRYLVLFMSAFGLVLTGCSGGSSGGSSSAGGGNSAPPSAEVAAVSAGSVTGFGSIFVNGVEIETASSAFEIDDRPGSEDELEVGDVVVVTLDPDAAVPTATKVFADESVEGPVDSVDTLAGLLVVAGQTVRADADTSFDDNISPASLQGLVAGDFVEVSGFFDAAGDIRATRIERHLAGEVEVHGFVSNLAGSTFNINALVVDFSSALIDDRFPGGMISDGDFVEVKGTDFGMDGELLATEVEPDGLGVAADDDLDLDQFDEVEVEIEGFITRFGSATDFDVSTFPVTTNGQTLYEGGTAADLAENVKVEVEGELNAAGVLVAAKVDIRRASVLRITALVDAVNPASNTVTLLGVPVRVDTLTRIEDKSDADLEPFMLNDIAAGNYLEIRGGVDPTAPGGVLASLLEREDVPDPDDLADDATELRGVVDAVSPPTVTVLGVTIETDAMTQFTGFTGAADFFASVQPGDVIDINGTEIANTSLLARQIQVEN